jgi:hypothetical protein
MPAADRTLALADIADLRAYEALQAFHSRSSS